MTKGTTTVSSNYFYENYTVISAYFPTVATAHDKKTTTVGQNGLSSWAFYSFGQDVLGAATWGNKAFRFIGQSENDG